MNVLVIGYGKIGAIKSAIWQRLGRTVFVYDTDARKVQQALDNGLRKFDQSVYSHHDWVVDISTPAAHHISSLQWVLELKPLPRAILIEKPLASNPTELLALQRVLAQKELQDFKQRIAVNESYFLSAALQYVAKNIRHHTARILSIDAELSKDRLEDVANGRFVDGHLGSLGIELPHMLAMLQILTIKLDTIRINTVAIHSKPGNIHNGGFTVNLSTAGISIRLRSYLGDFRFDNDSVTDNPLAIRQLRICTDKKDYTILFDPVLGIDRYKSQINITDHASGVSQVTVLDDDHLTENLKKLHFDRRDNELDRLLSVDNSVRHSRLIFELHKAARLHIVPVDRAQGLYRQPFQCAQ